MMQSPPTPLVQPFSAGVSLETIQTLLDHERQDPRPRWEGSAAAAALGSLLRAVAGHVLHLASQGQLQPIPFAQGRQINFVEIWNALALGQDMSTFRDGFYADEEHLAATLSQQFVPLLLNVRFDGNGSSRPAEDLSSELVARVEQGDFSIYDSAENYCFITGQRHLLAFDHWQPVLTERTQDHRHAPVSQEGPGVTLESQILPVPSGRLLIADWFRLEAFTAMTKEQERSEDIGCFMGRMALTRAYAPLGVASVFVGGSFPEVYQQAGRLMVGNPVDEEDGAPGPAGHPVGQVETAFRWVTMVDSQVLEDLLEKKLGRAAARQQLADYLTTDRDVRQVSLPPGEYHLYFSGDPHVFSQKFAAEGVSTAGFDVLRCVLSPQPLVLTEKPPLPEVSPAPRTPRRSL